MTDHDLQPLVELTPKGYALVPRIGIARAMLISAAMELGRRRTAISRITKNRITSSSDVYNRYVDRFCDLGYEELNVLLLKRSNDLLV
tara:strand:- start:1342 stop:1605 length:264 start_codon:yes stop_codon:yes gene_type:complete